MQLLKMSSLLYIVCWFSTVSLDDRPITHKTFPFVKTSETIDVSNKSLTDTTSNTSCGGPIDEHGQLFSVVNSVLHVFGCSHQGEHQGGGRSLDQSYDKERKQRFLAGRKTMPDLVPIKNISESAIGPLLSVKYYVCLYVPNQRNLMIQN